ncbi:hypothetical protein JCM10213v2_004879 [Rhodosporidiobolus nylandii]
MASQHSPEHTPASLGEIPLPSHLADQLHREQERFGKNISPDALNADLAAHDQRHQCIMSKKAAEGHDEVAHAKAIASTHSSDPSHEAPSRSRDPYDPRLDVARELKEGESYAEAK